MNLILFTLEEFRISSSSFWERTPKDCNLCKYLLGWPLAAHFVGLPAQTQGQITAATPCPPGTAAILSSCHAQGAFGLILFTLVEFQMSSSH
jgi:hypothetical protein